MNGKVTISKEIHDGIVLMTVRMAHFDDWWFYCEAHDDGMNGTNYFCTDDFGQSPDYENSASNDHYVTGGSPSNHDNHMSLDDFDVSN